MPEPSDAMKVKAREWLAESWPLELPAPLVSKLAALLAEAEAEGAKKERDAKRKVLSQKLCGCDATGDCMEHSK